MRRADLAPAGIYNAIGRANISTAGAARRDRAEPAVGCVRHLPPDVAGRADRQLLDHRRARRRRGASGSFAGHQLDARVRYWLVPSFLRAEVNALVLAKGRFLETAPNAPATGDTHYLSTALTATF